MQVEASSAEDQLIQVDPNDPEVLEERLITLTEDISETIQLLVSSSGLEGIVGAVGIELNFFDDLKIGDREETSNGLTTVWMAPGFLESRGAVEV